MALARLRLRPTCSRIVGPPKKLENVAPGLHPDAGAGAGGRDGLSQPGAGRHGRYRPAARPHRRWTGSSSSVLAAPDRQAAIAYGIVEALGLERGVDYTLPYSMINKAFDLPPETRTTITMVKHARMPIVEVDDYPAAVGAARPEPGHAAAGQCLG